jgi:hypothetical protein
MRKPTISEIVAIAFGLSGVSAALIAWKQYQVLAIVLFLAGCAALAALAVWPSKLRSDSRATMVLILSLALFSSAGWVAFGLDSWTVDARDPSPSAALGTPSPTAPASTPRSAPTAPEPRSSVPASPGLSTGTRGASNCVDVLPGPWRLQAAEGEAKQEFDFADRNILAGKSAVEIVYDLHGLTVNEGPRKDESAIVLYRPPQWYVASLANYGVNGQDGRQAVVVPISDFVGLPDEPSGTAGGNLLDPALPVNGIKARFWRPGPFIVDIYTVRACASG